MSLNRRKDEDILNDLHSAEGRLNSSEIIDLKTELETNEMKEKIHRANMENETAEVDKEQSAKMEELKKTLWWREKIDAVELQNICKEPILWWSNMQVIPFDRLETLLWTNNLLEWTKTEAYQKLIEKWFILGQGEPRIYNWTRRWWEDAVHLGIDYMVKSGTNIWAIEEGEIVNIETPTPDMWGHNWWWYGNMLMIKHTLPDGRKFYSLYGHIDPTKTFTLGDKVKKWEIIAKVAESFSAASWGRPSHLHFMLIQEWWTNGWYGNIEETDKLIDPLKVFSTKKQ